MRLIDTSVWVHWLRPSGDNAIASRVDAALHGGEAAWCPMVRLELWNGAAGEQEQKVLRRLATQLPELEIDDRVWSLACDFARAARAGGKTVPATDLVIFSCAIYHGVVLEHADADFDLLQSFQRP